MSFLLDILVQSWNVAAAMAPYLLLGFLIAGGLSVFLSPAWVERHLGGRGWAQILRASLFGVPLPLCSCGVLPVAASLRRQGASRGSTAAFLLSTPQTGVDSVAVTYGLLGPFLAVFRPLVAFVSGVLGGWLVHASEQRQVEASVQSNHDSESACCATEAEVELPRSPVLKALEHGFVTLPKDIGKALAIGIVVSGVLSAVVEPDLLSGALGTGLLPMFLAMVIGVPLYVCATASTPIALGLIHAGLSPGAALVFLISGPATNVASLATLGKVLGRRATVIYLATVMVTALASGLAVDLALDSGLVAPDLVVGGSARAGVETDHASHIEHQLSWFEHGAGIALFMILVAPVWPRRQSKAGEPQAEPAALVVSVEGMSCGGCVGNVTRALESCAGVEAVTVDLPTKEARITGVGMDGEEIVRSISGLGFEISNPEVLRNVKTC